MASAQMNDRLSVSDFIEQDRTVGENFICQICLFAVHSESAVTCDNCDQIFDKACLEESLKVKSTCPNCRKNMKQTRMNRINKNILNNLAVVCQRCEDKK